MSLTSFLKTNSDVREKIQQEFPKKPLRVKKDLLAPPLTKHYSTIGTAFDYPLRFYVKYLNKNLLDYGWIAEYTLSMFRGESDLYTKVEKIILRAREQEKTFLETGEITDELIESVLSLAYLDPIFRARRGYEYIGTAIDKKDIQDLRNLVTIIEPAFFKTDELCLLNPTFGASGLVEGADADLVIGDHLIEVKTTKKLELKLQHFQQLIGYYTLYRLGGFTGTDTQPKINRISIYFSRYAYFYTLNIEDLINQDTFDNFVDWFENRARFSSIYPFLKRSYQEESLIPTSFLESLLGISPKKLSQKTSFKQYGFTFTKVENKRKEAVWRIDKTAEQENLSPLRVAKEFEQKSTVVNQDQPKEVAISQEQGLTCKQFADYHGIPINTVKDWMTKGLSNFKPRKEKYKKILAEWYFKYDEDSNIRHWYKHDL